MAYSLLCYGVFGGAIPAAYALNCLKKMLVANALRAPRCQPFGPQPATPFSQSGIALRGSAARV